MLDNDNIITSVSEAVEKIPQMKKIIAIVLLYGVLPGTATTYKEQTNIYYS